MDFTIDIVDNVLTITDISVYDPMPRELWNVYYALEYNGEVVELDYNPITVTEHSIAVDGDGHYKVVLTFRDFNNPDILVEHSFIHTEAFDAVYAEKKADHIQSFCCKENDSTEWEKWRLMNDALTYAKELEDGVSGVCIINRAKNIDDGCGC